MAPLRGERIEQVADRTDAGQGFHEIRFPGDHVFRLLVGFGERLGRHVERGLHERIEPVLVILHAVEHARTDRQQRLAAELAVDVVRRLRGVRCRRIPGPCG